MQFEAEMRGQLVRLERFTGLFAGGGGVEGEVLSIAALITLLPRMGMTANAALLMMKMRMGEGAVLLRI